MTDSFKNLQAAFITKIQQAPSQEAVKQLINSALKNLEFKNGNSSGANVFIDAMICNLKMLNPMNKDAGEWSNINMARVYCQHLKRNNELTPVKS